MHARLSEGRSKDDLRAYRGAGVKRTMVTAVECISADGRSLFPLIIWPAATTEAHGLRIPPLDGILRAPNVDTPRRCKYGRQAAITVHLLYRARAQALTSRNIESGWSKTGLYPFNPDRVLRDVQKPLTELYVPKDDGVKVESCTQGIVPQTLVTSEALTLLQRRIEHDAHMLDSPGKYRPQNLANAV
jgi:hypothetical protein